MSYVHKGIDAEPHVSATGSSDSGDVAMETDADLDLTENSAMDTSVTEADTSDRNVCFILFSKFIEEVCLCASSFDRFLK